MTPAAVPQVQVTGLAATTNILADGQSTLDQLLGSGCVSMPYVASDGAKLCLVDM